MPLPPGLFTDPSPDAARQAFRAKPRAMVSKVSSVAEAVRTHVHDEDYLAIGGFGANRVPVAVCHEILRQGRQRLGFAGFTATHTFQLLCAGNLTGRGQTLQRVDASYIVGLEARGLSPHARRVVESGTVAITEWSNYAMALRFKAAAMGLSFLPTRSMLGTDTGNASCIRPITCPFTGTLMAAVPALYPDVAAIHVHEADCYGNARIRGVSVADVDLARAAKRLILTCERLIPHDEIRRDPNATAIPYYCVDAVCEVPYGGYPGNMAGEYFSDEAHLRHWLKTEADPAAHQQMLRELIFDQPDFQGYLQACGGLRRLSALRAQELLLDISA